MQELIFYITSLLVPLSLVAFIGYFRIKRGVDPFFGPDLIAIQVAVDSTILADPSVVLDRITHAGIRENMPAALLAAIAAGLLLIVATIFLEGMAADAKRQADNTAYKFWAIVSHAPLAAYIIAHFYVTTYPASFWRAFS